jgi:hypothetical protein
MSTELTMAMARQWERDYRAWMMDPGSGLAPLELLGRAANRIADLSALVAELESAIRSNSFSVVPGHD